uniref:Solute carrier family 15 member 1 n=1 Tax=Amphiprion ocellaris TaxID=80972 RepID=A0AAQ5ZMN1_AMPOC
MTDKEQGKKRKSKSATIAGYPISIFFIVVNEFCERFSYYGMRAVLVLYFKYFLLWDDDFATTIYHTFVALCYLTPILGAIIADSWLGKFKTIIYLSIVYTIGQVVMAVSAIHDITDTDRDGTPDNMSLHIALSMLGLLLIALGTGGIKPCVAAFGGDQFEDHQEKQRSTFFSIFYLSINAGSLLSTLITPILRGRITDHFPVCVFAVVFIVGSGMYNKTAPQGNIMVKVCKCIGFAISNRFRHRSSQYPKRHHWMDWAEEKYDKLLIAQVKMVLKVLFLYIPLPMFWALFDQQGSRWTLQATTMNGNFNRLYKNDSSSSHQTVNPILILVLVPIVDSLVYPLIAKCKLNFTPLKRMTVGMLLAGLAFVAAALVQLQIDQTLPTFPSSTVGQAKFINMINGNINITAGSNPITLDASDDYLTFDEPFNLNLGPGAENVVSLPDGTRSTIIIIQDAATYRSFSSLFCAELFILRILNGFNSTLNVTVGDEGFGDIVTNNMSEYIEVAQGTPKFVIRNDLGDECVYTQTLGFGSSYTLVIPSTFAFGPNCADSIRPVMDISPNSIHMAWQIPQYLLMTSGEVVFSVTGLEFSYSQAPSNMKSVLQAGWLLTVAVGNIIVLIVAEAATLEDQWAEYLLFTSLLVFVCIVFSVMAFFYKYIDPTKIEAQFAHMEPYEKEKKKSLDMTKKNLYGNDRRGSNSSNKGTQQTKM